MIKSEFRPRLKTLLRGFFLLLAVRTEAFGHTGHHHSAEKKIETPPTEAHTLLVQTLTAEYNLKVAPIVQGKCLHCHGGNTQMPWYHYLPGVSHLMNHHRKESAEHLDLSKDYPFISHASEKEDLEAMAKIAKDGSMPPWYYRLAHWNSGLTQKEREEIINWTNLGLNQMK